MPPVTRSTLHQPFRCVLVDAPGLARMAPEPFVFEAELEVAGPAGVASFPNLGGDALLVVPAGRAGVGMDAYAHLAAFLRMPRAVLARCERSGGGAPRAARTRSSSRPGR